MKAGQVGEIKVWTPECLTTNLSFSWKSESTVILHVTHRFHLLNLPSIMWACSICSHSAAQRKTRMNKLRENVYCWRLIVFDYLFVWVLQVNGHQIMDEPMEEGESFSNCVSKAAFKSLCMYTEHTAPVLLRACFILLSLCRMMGRIKRFLSPTMWKRAVRKLIHLSLNY